MPAPSPVLPSASTAPRCQIALSVLIPASTTRRDGLPSIDTTRPTPQEECSSSSAYMPLAANHSRLACCSSAQLRSNVVIGLYPSLIWWVSVSLTLSRRPAVGSSLEYRQVTATPQQRLALGPDSSGLPPPSRARRGSPKPQGMHRARYRPRQKPRPSRFAQW